MKTFFFTLAIAFIICPFSFAQTNQGKVHLAGSSDLSFASIKTRVEYDGRKVGEEVSQSSFNFNPSFGYFALDNLAIGISFSYEHNKIEDNKSTTSLIGPYGIYYFGHSNVRPFLRGEIGFGLQKESYENDEMKFDAIAFDLGGGVAVFVNDFVSLDFGLSYVNLTLSDSDDSWFKAISNGVSVFGGISVYL